jgi:hypothetical protein
MMQPPGIGIDAPEIVTAGREFTVIVLGPSNLVGIAMRIVEADSGRTVHRGPVRQRDSAGLTSSVRLDTPGLFRIEVAGGSRHAVERLLLVVPDAEE